MLQSTIHPGRPWLDTNGQPIQAHGGSIIAEGDEFYWYGENKEHTTGDNGIWHWGIRCYSSKDLMNWRDLGLIVPPNVTDPVSPLHPSQQMDRPHIVRHPTTGRYICWVKVMKPNGEQRTTVLASDSLTGPYEIVRSDFLPLGMSAGDFDLVVDPRTGSGVYIFERVHTELICADLNESLTGVTGVYSSHFERGCPPLVREAPAHFERQGIHYLVTSGTTAYFPNPSELASAATIHGPWTVLGDPHPDDSSRTSYNSQVSSVFRHPAKADLFIALADRWVPDLPEKAGQYFASGLASAVVQRVLADAFDPTGALGVRDSSAVPEISEGMRHKCESLFGLMTPETTRSTYVWLPFRFDRSVPYLEWRDEWSPDEFLSAET
jgi:hypothetical protein